MFTSRNSAVVECEEWMLSYLQGGRGKRGRAENSRKNTVEVRHGLDMQREPRYISGIFQIQHAVGMLRKKLH